MSVACCVNLLQKQTRHFRLLLTLKAFNQQNMGWLVTRDALFTEFRKLNIYQKLNRANNSHLGHLKFLFFLLLLKNNYVGVDLLSL